MVYVILAGQSGLFKSHGGATANPDPSPPPTPLRK